MYAFKNTQAQCNKEKDGMNWMRERCGVHRRVWRELKKSENYINIISKINKKVF